MKHGNTCLLLRQGRRLDWDHMAVWLVFCDYPSVPLSPSWANTPALFALCCNATREHRQLQPRKISAVRCCSSSNPSGNWAGSRQPVLACPDTVPQRQIISNGSQAATFILTLPEYPAPPTPTLLPLWAKGARARTEYTVRQSFCSNNWKEHES